MSNEYKIEKSLGLGDSTKDMLASSQTWNVTDSSGNESQVITNSWEGTKEVGEKIARGEMQKR